jgi:hypothetical protein
VGWYRQEKLEIWKLPNASQTTTITGQTGGLMWLQRKLSDLIKIGRKELDMD